MTTQTSYLYCLTKSDNVLHKQLVLSVIQPLLPSPETFVRFEIFLSAFYKMLLDMHILFCLACIAEYVKESSVLYFNYTLLNRKKKTANLSLCTNSFRRNC